MSVKCCIHGFILAALSAATLAAAPAGARVVDGQVFGKWAVRCGTPPGETERECGIQHRVVTENPKRMLLNVTVGYIGKNHSPLALFHVPVGVYLPPGLTLSIPGAPVVRIGYDQCTPHICRAPLPMTPALVSAMEKASRAVVTIEDSNQKPITLPMSLAGFTAGYKALSQP